MDALTSLSAPISVDRLQSLVAEAQAADKSGAQKKDKAREAAQEFEAVFLTGFIEQMFSGIETDGPFGGGHAEKIYRSMMSQEYAQNFARNGGVGIADQVYGEILKAQEAGNQ